MNGERQSVDAEATRRIRSETLQTNPQEITQLLADWRHGDRAALEKLTPLVYEAPAGVTYGGLKLDPEWDVLRSDPRFEKIVASLAPK